MATPSKNASPSPLKTATDNARTREELRKTAETPREQLVIEGEAHSLDDVRALVSHASVEGAQVSLARTGADLYQALGARDSGDGFTVAGGDAGAMDAEVAQLLSGSEIQWAPIFLRLEPGDVVRGWLVGRGVTDVEDQQTRESKTVGTWILADGPGKNARRAQFLSAHQLEGDLVEVINGVIEPKFGRYVIIARLADERTSKGRMVARFRIGWPEGVPALPGFEKGGVK